MSEDEHYEARILSKPFPGALNTVAQNTFGWMTPAEGLALFETALQTRMPIVEIGTYCGRSTVYLGAAALENDNVVYSIDHHYGSPEHQQGERYHTPGLDTLYQARKTLRETDLEQHVILIVGDSRDVVRGWESRIGMLFIDGNHEPGAVYQDYFNWMPFAHGFLALHDCDWPGPAAVYTQAQIDGWVETEYSIGSLRILKR